MMSDYSELIEQLRYCHEQRGCLKCKLSEVYDCTSDLTGDAAAAIEELSKTVKDLTTKVECSPMQISEKAFDRAIEAWNERARKEVQDG